MAVAPNSALDAAVAALQAQPYPWFLPVYSIRLSDPAVYASIVATYGFGTPVIIGLSPTDAEVLTGLTISQDTSYAAQIVVPQIFVHPDAQNVLGTIVPLNVSGGTIFTSYATPFGRSDRVVWEWQCDVQLDPAVAYVAPTTGRYEQEIVTWVGDNAAGRLIPTTFDLTVGVVAVWICGGVGAGIKDVNCFRYRGMSGTSIMGAGASPVTTYGIMSFTASGFTVTEGDFAGFPIANFLGNSYTAIVMRDTTGDNRYLRVGGYTGTGNFDDAMTVQADLTHVTGGFLLAWDGLPVTDISFGTGNYVFHFLSPTAGFLTPAYRGAPGGVNFHFTGAPRVFPVGFTPTHLWIWGVNVAYRSFEFVTDDCLSSIAISGSAVADAIKDLSAGGFTVGADVNTNSSGSIYNWLALNADAFFLAQHLFASFKTTGAGAPPTPVTGFGFIPGLAFAERFTTPALTSGGIWRGPDQAGTDSTYCAFYAPSNDVPAQGIRSMDADGITIGTEIAPIGVDAYGWAFKTSGSVIPPAAAPGPPYNPVAAPPGSYVPNGALLTGGPGFGAGRTTPCGCPLEE